jgi:hypothetical protein
MISKALSMVKAYIELFLGEAFLGGGYIEGGG